MTPDRARWSASDAVRFALEGAALWREERALPNAVARDALLLLAGPPFEVRVAGGTEDLASTVAGALVEGVVAGPLDPTAFAVDVAALGGLVAAAAGCAHVVVRVEHELGGRCPVFHQDNYRMRLLCTYAGPGTEWLPEDLVDRSQLGLRGRTPPEANAAIALGEPQRCRPGEVMIIKGARYDGGHDALVHRSPPPQLGPRLFVAIDPVESERPPLARLA